MADMLVATLDGVRPTAVIRSSSVGRRWENSSGMPPSAESGSYDAVGGCDVEGQALQHACRIAGLYNRRVSLVSNFLAVTPQYLVHHHRQ